jgi:hypothetical protein
MIGEIAMLRVPDDLYNAYNKRAKCVCGLKPIRDHKWQFDVADETMAIWGDCITL